MFVMAHTFFAIFNLPKYRRLPLSEISKECLQRVGHSVTLTSFTNSAGFFLAAIIPIPAMRDFAFQVCTSNKDKRSVCFKRCLINRLAFVWCSITWLSCWHCQPTFALMDTEFDLVFVMDAAVGELCCHSYVIVLGVGKQAWPDPMNDRTLSILIIRLPMGNQQALISR